MKEDKIEEFNSALMNNDQTKIEGMLKDGFNPNSINEYGNHMLYIASEFSNDSICKLLVKAGANVNMQNIYGNTALISAATNGRDNLVDFYISKNADITTKNHKGSDAIGLARTYCQDEIAEKLENIKQDQLGLEK